MSVMRFLQLEQAQELSEKLVRRISALATRLQTLEETGAQANVIERILVNGMLQVPDETKSIDLSVPTKVNELENDANYQENKIEHILQNGSELGIDETKSVDIHVPVNLSELVNDADFQNGEDVAASIQTAISKSGHASYVKADAVPSAEEAEENILYLVMNDTTGHYDIYAKIGESMELLDDTTVDLSGYVEREELDGYVEKEEGKGLSANDYTDADKAKMKGMEENANHYVLDKQKVIDALGYTPGNTDAMTVLWENVEEKPESYPPSEHSHDLNAMINSQLSTGTSTPTDADYYISQYAGGGTSTTTYHRRPLSALWAYIKAKADAAYQAKGSYAAASHTHKSVIDNNNGSSATTFCYSKAGMNYADYTWLAGWNGYELRAVAKTQFAQASHTHDDRYYTESEMNTKLNAKANSSHTHNYAGSGSAGGTANSVNGFTFGVQSSDPGAGSSLATNKILLVYK